MIYFNDKKEAFSYKIDNSILTLDDSIWAKFCNDPSSWDIIDNEFIDLRESDDYKAEQAQKEENRINNLTMTALDFIGVLQSFGLTLEQINAYLESNLAVKMQLTYCQNVYCGVVKQLMPVTVGDKEITADMVEIAFRVKNGEKIADSEPPVDEDTGVVTNEEEE